MSTKAPPPPKRSTFLRATAAAALVVSVSACNTLSSQAPAPEAGIAFREARFEEISAMRNFRDCRDDALELDRLARAEGSPGRYLASARLLEKCESEAGPEVAGVAVEERMQAKAISIQNFIKAGDIEAASHGLSRLKTAFPGRDIYFADGASFIETMETLLGERSSVQGGTGLLPANISADLKSELNRVHHWSRN